MNPFQLKGYVSAEYFCNREAEIQKLTDSVNNNQDVTLYALRRMGKSALLQHLFNHISKENYCIYIDLWGTTSLHEFTKTLADAVVKSDVFAKRPVSKKMIDFIKTIGASFSIGMDGNPSVGLLYNDRAQLFENLEQILTFLNGLKIPTVLAIDEFQEIKKYEQSAPFEAKLRTFTQQFTNIRFIYSGSEYHILNEIFNTYSHPFYQSTRMMMLDKIEEKEYFDFILNHFQSRKKNISEDIIKHILFITYRHTYYVQAVCNFIFGLSKMPTTIGNFEKKYADFLLEKSVFYSELPDRLTSKQSVCVKAIAQQGLVKNPTSARFLAKISMTTPSSMQRIIKALLSKQLIIKEDEGYRLYDVFLEHYLKLKM